MNRREFCQSAVCAAVIAALPAQPEQTYMGMTHDGTDASYHFAKLQPWQEELVALIERNPHVIITPWRR